MGSDEMLMMKYREGSEEAFNLLYERYSSTVYGYIRRHLRQEEVDDFFQKVWRQLHEKRLLYNDQPFAPWFFVLIKNLLIDEYRALGRFERDRRKNRIDHLPVDQQKLDVEVLLEELPPESAELVRKYYLEEVSYENLERELGISQATLRQRLSRAIRTLRGRLV